MAGPSLPEEPAIEIGLEDKIAARPDDLSSRQFALNVSSNVALVLLNIVVGLWFTPYLITVLGVAMFGISSLANSLSSYVLIINSAVISAVGRYLSIHMRRGETAAANRTFNTALALSVAATLASLPLIGAIAYLSPRWFDIPPDQETAAIWLFAIAMATATVVMVRGVFTASAFVRNRLELQNVVLAANIVGRTVVTVILFVVVIPSLWAISWGLVVGSLVSFVLALVVWRRLTPELRLNRRDFDRSQLRSLSGMSGWLGINLVGSTLLLNIDLVVVNRLLGATAQGRYASVWQWVLLLHTLARTVASALLPITLSQYAAGDLMRMKTVSQQAVKFLGLALALPVGLLLAFATPLLLVWLGPDFADLAPLLQVMTFHLAVNLAVSPLMSIQVALNKVVWPALVTLGSGLVTVVLAFQWGRIDALGMGVTLAAAVGLTLRSALFTPLYSARIQRLPWWTFFPALLFAAAGTAIATGIGFLLLRLWAVSNWPQLIAAGLLVSAVYTLVTVTILLNRADRQLVGRFLPARLRARVSLEGKG